MWQRIQTIFLSIVVIISVVGLFFPLMQIEMEAGTLISITPLENVITGNLHTAIANPIWVGILEILTAVFTLFIILKYKKRILQIRLLSIDMLLNLMIIAAMFLITDSTVKSLEVLHPDYAIACGVPIVNVILILLANRAIRKDEVKVRTADRIR